MEEGFSLTNLGNEQIQGIFQFASATGGLTATNKGVIPSLPTRQKVNIFLCERCKSKKEHSRSCSISTRGYTDESFT